MPHPLRNVRSIPLGAVHLRRYRSGAGRPHSLNTSSRIAVMAFDTGVIQIRMEGVLFLLSSST